MHEPNGKRRVSCQAPVLTDCSLSYELGGLWCFYESSAALQYNTYKGGRSAGSRGGGRHGGLRRTTISGELRCHLFLLS